MDLPLLKYDFNDARIEAVTIGTRREVTLRIELLKWQGNRGEFGEPLNVRFGGIENITEVSEFFSRKPHEISELAWMRYTESVPPKSGKLSIDLQFERIDAGITVRCSSLQISPAK